MPEYKVKCECRKPSPGLLLRAAKEYNIDLNQSWMIGDSEIDVEAGIAAGCKVVKLGEGKNIQIYFAALRIFYHR
ncbi:HAD-IIIA family hydrolase [[Clostridium] hylemonae]|uniref:HAD-IIIA family hydrolase n=1 Tax=[Clostridium] hylemonae TaxID=89153 RepID=UPI001FA96EB7|nr:HAD-IIIA family hydrolase [[Clostridium] hylemonae]